MEELRDIQGLDQITHWPLAIGWWVVIGVALTTLMVALLLWYKRFMYKKSWQYQSFCVLQRVEQLQDSKQLLDSLAVEIRRIAMQTATRKTCAGLVGKQWLQWLQEHDPYKFAWTTHGQVLVQYQYMPGATSFDNTQIKQLIAAAKKWVNKC